MKKKKKKYIVEHPIKIKLMIPAIEILKCLSKSDKKELKAIIIKSSKFIIENYFHLPERELFEYLVPHGTLLFGYVAFWDRRLGKECVVIATLGWCRFEDVTAGYKKEMITDFMNGYFLGRQY